MGASRDGVGTGTQARRKGPVHPGSRAIQFDVWGSRGSRSLVPPQSRIGNYTSCYSVLDGRDLFALDAGRGLAALAHAVGTQARFRNVARLHVLVTHAHVDHWEGLKDADWFWLRRSRLAITVFGPREALDAIRAGHAPPSYVPLGVLARGMNARLSYRALRSGATRAIGRWTVRTEALNHFSGDGSWRRRLDTIGYRLAVPGGPTVAYISDHEPSAGMAAAEARLVKGADLAVYDAHFSEVREQTYGHGSHEHSARVARTSPATLVLAGHHCPACSDDQIRGALRRHGRGLRNYRLAIEGRTYVWDPLKAGFRPLRP